MAGSLRSVLTVLAFCGSTALALASASSTPTDYTPDPALKRASIGSLIGKVQNACNVVQKRNNDSISDLNRKCSCYAMQTMRSLSKDELTEYRNTGVFNSSARSKAYAALDSCGLPRP